MAAPLSSIFTALNARIAAVWQAAHPSTYNTTDILALTYGADQVHQEAAPPRIVWVPVEENFAPAVGIGHGGDGVSSPLPLWTSEVSLEVHVWGRSQDEIEGLRNIVVGALHMVAHGAYTLSRAQWMNATGAALTYGVEYVLEARVMVPVLRDLTELTTATITALPLTGEADFANGNVVTPV